MLDHSQLQDYVAPISKWELNHDTEYSDLQIGATIDAYEEGAWPDISSADIILLGAGEERGSLRNSTNNAPDAIRAAFYKLYHWHSDVKLADLGNLLTGKTLGDAYAAFTAVVTEMIDAGKIVIILGGSHDLTYAQYKAYASKQYIIEVTVADALIDLHEGSPNRSQNFLMDLFTEQPNYIRHYNHVGFQSYFVQPRMLETLDKLRFDCYRLGRIRENLDDIEPVLRNTDMFSFDISAIRHADAPANTLSPNGFTGEEACVISRYAGMSAQMSTFGVYGYQHEKDKDGLTAMQIAQMMWYFMDGRSVRNKEAMLHERESFLEFHIAFSDIHATFLKSKKTGRWWMQLPDNTYIPCAYSDYLLASNNEIPERWLRSQERS
ncbi:arginase family enzyme [Chitinophaga skermanii]|uniref:Arginase family enzyme n=1 Tax=Chitinophaga skermanii TaxID=331697 RepID=A0A327Q462_9BACT|nr:formimidoylglutamase [Chitinophaga skermanii]RAI98704.1 arginase family enzyme [Chitinophaga skermanii]